MAPSARNPAIRGIRYKVLATTHLFASHSITKLAAALFLLAHQGRLRRSAARRDNLLRA